ncbi:Polyketide synthase [Kitasatospora cheerisanensis KCTC 2395]|uniref:Polyketide synthase n=1 Tax=Kitasatospora cheerisanensis KCTC 2395 TaxID=1348663 RepID=A0A066YH08_9ACTN|nr:Polyketide synthase [Kitasatospora cheerisanensis KCTC 2395]
MSLDPVGDRPFWVHATITREDEDELTGDLALHAEDGTPLGGITGFRAAGVERAAASVGPAAIDGWLAEPVWTDLPADTGDAPPPDRLLVLADAHGLAEQLAARQRERGGHCHLVRPGAAYRHGPDGSTVRPGSADDLRRLFADLDEGYDTVLHLWNLDLPSIDTAGREQLTDCGTLGGYSLVALAQVLPSARPNGRLHIVTRGAQAVEDGDPVEPLGAPAWGVGRVLWQQELVGHRGKLIDLAGTAEHPADHSAEAAALLRELAVEDAEEIALRGPRRATCRLARPAGLTRPLPLRLRADGSYLVTGAFGALGRLLCRTLVKRGARRLILAGRTALPPREQWADTDPDTPAGRRVAFLRELEELGAQAVPVPLDVTDETALADWLADHRRRQLPPVRGVFHLAGQVRDALVPELDRELFDAAYEPKVVGARNLHRQLRGEPLDHFVLFASIASVLTTAGQANYAAGNAFLDALAHHRRARGLPALSIDWGPWATGMIEELGLVGHYREARGMSSLPPAAGMAVLERVIGQDRAQLLVATVVDWPVFQAWYATPPALVAELAAAAETVQAAPAGGFPAAFRAADPDARRQLVAERFTELVAGVLRANPERIDPAAGLNGLGLDSLLAMELRARIHAEMGVSLPVVTLLSGDRVGELIERVHAGLLESAAADGPGPEAEVELHTDERRYPLTQNQKALWFLKQLNPDAFAYNIGGAVEVRTELDPELMFDAFRVLLERHPCLRANFVLEDGQAVQLISAEARPDTGLFDVQDRDWDDIHRTIVQEYRKPYDLERDPLVRLRLFKRGPDRWVIMKAVHHIVSDAISTFTFIDELFTLYEAARSGRTVELPPVPARYLDFLNWQNRLLAGPDAPRMLEYWRTHLPAEAPVLGLPTDKPRPSVQTHNGASEFFKLDEELSGRVQELAREHDVTVYMVLLSAYYLLLHRYSGQDDIIVGSPVTGRTREEFGSVYGYFVNPLPLHVGLADRPSVAGLLARVRETVLGGLDNQEYPFVVLVEQLGLQRDPSRSAVFQAMFILLTHKVATDKYGYHLDYIELPEEEGQFDITLSAYQDRSDNCYHCVFKYNTDLFEPATMQRMAGHYRNLLDALTSAPRTGPPTGCRCSPPPNRNSSSTGGAAPTAPNPPTPPCTS